MSQAPPVSNPLVILDRDGVINHDSDAYIKSVAEWIPVAGSIEAIARLCHAGFRVAVASNQSGLARGLFTITELNSMHQKLRRLVSAQGGRLEVIAFCPHGPRTGCRCRKPAPGLLEEIADRLRCDLASAVFIGDSISDVKAARSVGAIPWLVRTGKGERTLADAGRGNPESELAGVPVHASLDAAVAALLNDQGHL